LCFCDSRSTDLELSASQHENGSVTDGFSLSAQSALVQTIISVILTTDFTAVCFFALAVIDITTTNAVI
jgi:hypothetical protein